MTDTVAPMEAPTPRLRPAILFTLALCSTLLGMAGWSASAQALNYCVPSMIGGCDQNFGTIQGALDQAASEPGHDNVWIATGNYSGHFVYNETSPGNSIEIRGMGTSPEQTTLTFPSSINGETSLKVTAPGDSKITNLKVSLPPSLGEYGGVGIDADGVGTDQITVSKVLVDSPDASNADGIQCGRCTIVNSEIDVTTSEEIGNFAVRQDGGPARVESSELIGSYGFRHSDPGLTSTISRSRIEAHKGAFTDAGFVDINDSLIELDGDDQAVGVTYHDPGGGTTEIGGSLDGVTIVNGVDNSDPSPKRSTGILAIADSAQERVNVNLSNSVISGFTNFPKGLPLDLGVNFGGILNFVSDFSAFNYGSTGQSWDNADNFRFSVGDDHVNLDEGPKYANEATGNYTPAADSDLVDAGDPAGVLTGAKDLPGNPRACHGKPDGVIRRDIGAFEFKTDPEDDCTYPETMIVSGPAAQTTDLTPAFGFATDKNPGTFLCSWDGAPEIVCPYSTKAPDFGIGHHSLSVRVKDEYGNIDPTPETRDFEVIEKTQPTCETDPALCPVTDTTPPKILGLKALKKTKAASVKIRFRSNEPGVTFTCKLNKTKAKKCKSPWKTPRLKKGKNTIVIQATDRAGNKSKPAKLAVKKLVKPKRR